MRGKLVGLALASLLLTTPAAAQSPDVEDWLARPGVKLVALDFYASWCTPCKASLPRWAEIYERFRDKGLRVIVVATQDPKGKCTVEGFRPDRVVCDLDGAVADAYRVGSELPAAFLWSWQGNLLLERASVDDVAAAVEAYLKESPRVAVEALDAQGQQAPMLEALIRAEFARSARFDILSSKDEIERIRALRKESYDLRRDEEQQCRLGAEVSANSLVQARVLHEGPEARLAVGLHNLETGCQSALATVPLGARAPEVAVAEAVGALMRQVAGEVHMPEGAERQTDAQAFVKRAEDDWRTTAKYVLFSDASYDERRAQLDGYLKKYPQGAPYLDVAQKWRSYMDGIKDPASRRASLKKHLLYSGIYTLSISWLSYALPMSVLSAVGRELNSDEHEPPASLVWKPWIPVAGPFLVIADTDGPVFAAINGFTGACEAGGALAIILGLAIPGGGPIDGALDESGLGSTNGDASYRFGRDWIVMPVTGPSWGGLGVVGRF